MSSNLPAWMHGVGELKQATDPASKLYSTQVFRSFPLAQIRAHCYEACYTVCLKRHVAHFVARSVRVEMLLWTTQSRF